MPEEVEIETQDLQDTVHEAHSEHKAHGDAEGASWTRSIALTTAILAVFAAVGALQSGSLVNEAMIQQIKASDTWNEYQASREKTHLYTVALDNMLDSNHLTLGEGKGAKLPKFTSAAPADRAKEFKGQIDAEDEKASSLSEKAKKFEEDGERMMKGHHMFAYEVALIQVAIALGAVSALTRVRWVWGLSMGVGVVGVVLFVLGFLAQA